MALHVRTVMGSAVVVFLAGLALWPPRAVYWTRLTAVVGDAITLAVVALLAAVLGAALQYATAVAVRTFAVGGLVAYLAGMAAIEMWVVPDSPAHLVWYAVLLACLVGGAALRVRYDAQSASM